MNERVMMMFALVNEVFSRWIESVSELEQACSVGLFRRQ